MKDYSLEYSDAIVNGKWLNIKYNNGKEISKFYAAIVDFDIEKRILYVKMFNLSKGKNILEKNDNSKYDGIKIFIDKIISLSVLQHITYDPTNELRKKISDLKLKKTWINSYLGEKRIFNYYTHCLKYDVSPIVSETFSLDKIDKSIFKKSSFFKPEASQYFDILSKVTNFDKKVDPKRDSSISYAFNLLSIKTPKGRFPILYRDFEISLGKEILKLGNNIKVNRSIKINDYSYHVSTYLEMEEKDLISLYKKSPSKLKRLIEKKKNVSKEIIDTTPILYTLRRDQIVNIDEELKTIRDIEDKHHPLNAFLGKLTNRNKGRKEYPIFLVDKNVNIDQLRVVNNSLRMPVTYVQGPPGTGKTTTIQNVILSYFANNRTVLLSSYNNKPVTDVYNKLTNLKYKKKIIPLPILRLGNKEKVAETLLCIKASYLKVRDIMVYENTLDKMKKTQITNLKEFYRLLDDYEEVVDLRDKRDNLKLFYDQVSKSDETMFNFKIKVDAEISEIDNKLDKIGSIPDDKALELLNLDFDEFYKWLFYISCWYIKKIDLIENKEFKEILLGEYNVETEIADKFNLYISNSSNLRKILKIFPIIISTNLSIPRLGSPKPVFDITIIDEAGQCNIPSSLLAIARGEKLLLVGDTQQLQPVISLEEPINRRLKELYKIRDEYDYINNSILSVMREIDTVSLRVLLRFHYRCKENIIHYSNKQYYKEQLKVMTLGDHKGELLFDNVQSSKYQDNRNTSEEEVRRIETILRENPDKNYGIITPFRSQSELIKSRISKKYPMVEIGTIHKFQGGEKDGIIISCGITQDTHQKTYDWLKGNHPLINVAITRAKSELRILGDYKTISKLSDKDDHFIQLIKYVKSNGKIKHIKIDNDGSNIKKYDTYFEKQFKETIDIAIKHFDKLRFEKKVKIASILKSAKNSDFEYFTRGEFDFVIFSREKVIAVYEVDGKEHESHEITIERDKKKKEICDKDNILLFRIKNKDVKNYEMIKRKLLDLIK